MIFFSLVVMFAVPANTLVDDAIDFWDTMVDKFKEIFAFDGLERIDEAHCYHNITTAGEIGDALKIAKIALHISTLAYIYRERAKDPDSWYNHSHLQDTLDDLKLEGFTDISFYPDAFPQTNDHLENAFASMAKYEEKYVMIIGFAGSMYAEDLLVTAQALATDFLTGEEIGDIDSKYEASLGFASRFKDIFDDKSKFEDKIQKLLNESYENGTNFQEIYIVGHSLGGAVAQLAAVHLYERLIFEEGTKFILATLASPRVYRKASANEVQTKYIDDPAMNFHSYRFVNYGDIVPNFPFRWAGFSHLGATYYINHVKCNDDSQAWRFTRQGKDFAPPANATTIDHHRIYGPYDQKSYGERIDIISPPMMQHTEVTQPHEGYAQI